MRKQTAHKELLHSVLRGKLTEKDALLWMLLLHTHEIHLRPGIVKGVGAGHADQPFVLAALTQRSAASVIASFWPKRKKRQDERATYIYWYWLFNTRTPYEVFADVPQELTPRLMELRKILAQEPRVAAVVEED